MYVVQKRGIPILSLKFPSLLCDGGIEVVFLVGVAIGDKFGVAMPVPLKGIPAQSTYSQSEDYLGGALKRTQPSGDFRCRI